MVTISMVIVDTEVVKSLVVLVRFVFKNNNQFSKVGYGARLKIGKARLN